MDHKGEGDDAFAIDFTSYQRSVPLLNISGGTRVLSPADGIVRRARGHVPSGADCQTNEVLISQEVVRGAVTWDRARGVLEGTRVALPRA